MTEQTHALMTIGNQAMEYRDPAAVAAAESAKAVIQAAYIMAMQRPRNIDQARVNIMAACKRPVFAAKAEYSKPMGKERIKGPSVRFAEMAVRAMGNIDVQSSVVYEDDKVRRVRVRVIDLEANASFAKDVTINKTVERRMAGKDREIIGQRLNTNGDTVYIVAATDDELSTKEAAAISKVVRNEGLRLVPADLIEEGMQQARETLSAGDAKDPETARRAMCDAFAQIGVQPVMISQFLGHPLEQTNPKELAELRAMYAAIKDGEARWSDYTANEDDTRPAPGKGLADKLKTSKPVVPATPTPDAKTGPEYAAVAALASVQMPVAIAEMYLRAVGNLAPDKQLAALDADTLALIAADPTAFKRRVSEWTDQQDSK